MKKILFGVIALTMAFASCKDDDGGDDMMMNGPTPKDPDKAEVVSVDRFSADAGNLMVRDGSNGLPEANEAINYDMGPFITKGLGPQGEMVEYYNFDVQPTAPAPIFVLFRNGESTPVEGQLNIINVIPGDAGYNDFWLVTKVTVPSDYKANVITSFSEIASAGYPTETTTLVVNCPVVPEGSTATKRIGGGNAGLIRGWYKGKVVNYFSFEEKALMTSNGMVPTSPIFVTFNINPDMSGGGPPSGFKTETSSDQTHNVIETIPADAAYSPLWLVNVYDNAAFDNVSDLTSAKSAPLMASGVATVNCPVVSIN